MYAVRAPDGGVRFPITATYHHSELRARHIARACTNCLLVQRRHYDSRLTSSRLATIKTYVNVPYSPSSTSVPPIRSSKQTLLRHGNHCSVVCTYTVCGIEIPSHRPVRYSTLTASSTATGGSGSSINRLPGSPGPKP